MTYGQESTDVAGPDLYKKNVDLAENALYESARHDYGLDI